MGFGFLCGCPLKLSLFFEKDVILSFCARNYFSSYLIISYTLTLELTSKVKMAHVLILDDSKKLETVSSTIFKHFSIIIT